MLQEDFHESLRLLMTEYPSDMTRLMQTAERQTSELVDRLQTRPSEVPHILAQLRETCIACHRQYRD